MKRLVSMLIVLVGCFSQVCSADTVYMKSGAVIEGTVLQETATAVVIQRGSTAIELSKALTNRIERSGQAPGAAPQGVQPGSATARSGQPGTAPFSASPAATVAQPAVGPFLQPQATAVTSPGPFLPAQAAAPTESHVSPTESHVSPTESHVSPTPLPTMAGPFIVAPASQPAAGLESPATSPISTVGQRYAIQVVATTSAAIAKDTASLLIGKGYKNTYIIYDPPYFKTRVGTFGSKGEADQVNQRLSAELQQTCWLTDESHSEQEVQQAIEQTAKGMLPIAKD